MKKIIINIAVLFLLIFLVTDCAKESLSADTASNTGIAGSYARFMIVGDFFYIIDFENIKTFSLANPALPELINEQTIGSRIESIFNLEDKLFIGSGTGMYIYTIDENTGIPDLTSSFSYDIFPIYPCDPVVANQEYAYVTLNSSIRSQACGGIATTLINELVIFDIPNIEAPQLIAEYPMEHPKGLGIDGNLLFLCDDTAGLKIYDATDPLDIQLTHHFDTFTAYDVIPLGGLLLVVGPENVYQFDYSDPSNIQLISTIPIKV